MVTVYGVCVRDPRVTVDSTQSPEREPEPAVAAPPPYGYIYRIAVYLYTTFLKVKLNLD